MMDHQQSLEESQSLTGDHLQRSTLQQIQASGRSLYQVLDIPITATPEQIKRAYRQLAKLQHPDKTDESNAHDQFQQTKCAYHILKNPNAKAIYDQLGYEGLLVADSMESPSDFGHVNPAFKLLFLIGGILTLGYCCFGLCFCCNCCCGSPSCKRFMTRIVGQSNMNLYEQAVMEAQVAEVVSVTQQRIARQPTLDASTNSNLDASTNFSSNDHLAASTRTSTASTMISPTATGDSAGGLDRGSAATFVTNVESRRTSLMPNRPSGLRNGTFADNDDRDDRPSRPLISLGEE